MHDNFEDHDDSIEYEIEVETDADVQAVPMTVWCWHATCCRRDCRLSRYARARPFRGNYPANSHA